MTSSKDTTKKLGLAFPKCGIFGKNPSWNKEWGETDVQNWVVVSNIFHFHPYLGKWSNLTNIFQMGWNHQLENVIIIEVSDTVYLFFSGLETRLSNPWLAMVRPRLKHPPVWSIPPERLPFSWIFGQLWHKLEEKTQGNEVEWGWPMLIDMIWCLMKQVWTLYVMICIHHPLKTTTVCRRKKSFPDDVPFCFFQMHTSPCPVPRNFRKQPN